MQITIIGGGSYQWTPELLADLLGTAVAARGPHRAGGHRPGAPGEDGGPGPPARRGLGAGATVATTTDQRRALEGADFVIVTISTGGFDSMAVDLDVPARYGIRQSVGDTRRPRWDQPLAAQHAGAGRRRRGHGGAVPRRLAAQHHQPDDLPDPGGLPGDVGPGRRALPRGGQLVPRPGHRPRQAGRGDRVRRWPGSTTSRWSPRSTSTGEDGFAVLAEMVEEAGGLGRAGRPSRARPRPSTFSPARLRAAATCSSSTFLDQWGAVPAAGDRHLAEFVPWVLTEESGWGTAYNIELTDHRDPPGATRTATWPTSTPGWPAPRTSRRGRRASCRPW